MIRLNHVNISFGNKIVIQDGELMIHRGRVTAVTGPSGSGKTTLLYCLGLLSSQTGHRYEFDGVRVSLTDDRQKAAYRKQKIGYVFQDNNLIETMNVRDNLLTSLSMAGGAPKNKVEKAEELLELIGLSDKSGLYPRQLSGGEKQRTAIACALIKNPDLIIADEPTSALDSGNADAVFGLLQKIAREQGKMVVVATHDPNIYSRADDLYVIEDRKVHLQSAAATIVQHREDVFKPSTKKIASSFYSRYIRANSRRNQLRKRLITLFCALAVSFISLCIDFGQNFVAVQEDLMNRISNREIFVVNATSTKERTQAKYDPSDRSFDSKLYKQIKKTSGVDQVIPYFEIWGSKIDGKDFFYYVVPYYPDQLMDQKSGLFDETVPKTEGVYLSNQLARELEIKRLDGRDLSLSLAVPTKLKETELENTVVEQPVTEPDVLAVSVRGVLEGQIENSYSDSGKNVIYVPYEVLQSLLDEHKAEKLELGEKEWAPSACWVTAYRYSEVTAVKNDIKKLDPKILAYNRYQDFESMTTSIQETRQVMLIISIAILVIVFLMVTVIRVHETERRKYEVCVLKANGMTRKEVYRLVLTESLWEAAKILVIAFLFTCLLAALTNFVLFHQELILINWKLVLALLGISLLSVTAPSVATILFTNRCEPDKLMRN